MVLNVGINGSSRIDTTDAVSKAQGPGVVTPDQLRKVLQKMTFGSDQAEAVRHLAAQIEDKGGAAAVIAEEIKFGSDKTLALAYLNGTEQDQATQAPKRVTVQNPTIMDRVGGFVHGLTTPLRHIPGIAITAVLGAWAFHLLGVPLHDFPILNYLSQISGIHGFGADFLSAFEGIAGCSAIVGATKGFSEPKMAGVESAATGANVGSAKAGV
jgi:hypothetical protein